MTHRKLPDIEFEYGSGSDDECEQLEYYKHTVTVYHHKSDNTAARVARTEMGKQHLREVVLARRVAVDAVQTTMREVKKQSRRGADADRGVVKARAIETGREIAKKYRKGSSDAIMLLLNRVATQQIKKILPPRVTLVESPRPSLTMPSRMPEIVEVLDQIALNTDDESCLELQQMIERVELPRFSIPIIFAEFWLLCSFLGQSFKISNKSTKWSRNK